MLNKQTYISAVHLSGYKSVKNVSCKFDQGLNIIIGNNGSGKSNILEFINKTLNRKHSGLNAPFNADIYICEGNNSYRTGTIDLDESNTYRWHTEGSISKKRRDIENSGIAISGPSEEISFYTEFIEFNLPDNIGILSKELNPKYDLENQWLMFDGVEENVPFVISVWLRTIFIERDPVQNNKLVESNGEYLYENLTKSFDYYFDVLKKKINNYTPIQDIRFSNSVHIAKMDSSTLEFRNLVFEYKINNDWFGWGALSDGTRRLIYLIFSINGFDIYESGTKLFPITFIEEPEIGIHPHQLHLLSDFLREKSKDQQIIITTHSPQVLDILGPNEINKIIIAEIDYENGTVLRHLNEEEIKKAQFYFKDKGLLSDYWRFSDFQRSSKIK